MTASAESGSPSAGACADAQASAPRLASQRPAAPVWRNQARGRASLPALPSQPWHERRLAALLLRPRFASAAGDGLQRLLPGDARGRADQGLRRRRADSPPHLTSDVVAVTRAANVTPGNVAREVYNVGSGSRIGVNEPLDLICELGGRPLDVHYLPRSTGNARDAGADATLAEKAPALRTQLGLPEGLRPQFEWMLEASRP